MLNMLMIRLPRNKKIIMVSIIFIIYAVSMGLILDAHINLGTYYNSNDPIDTDLIYDLEMADYFVFNSTQSLLENYSIGVENFFQKGSWDLLKLRSITNNTRFIQDSIDYCNVTYDESIGLLKYNYTNNDIIEIVSENSFKIKMEMETAMKILNYKELMFINITSGNATNIHVKFEDVDIFEDVDELGNASIRAFDFEGITYHGIKIGDTFDILPYDNNSFPETIYYPEVDTNFFKIFSNTIIANATLGGIFQQPDLSYDDGLFKQPIAFPYDLSINDIVQNGSGLLKTYLLMIFGSEDLLFGNFFDDYDWEIEDSYNSTIANIYSDKMAGYIFTYIENGFNDYDDVQFNMTISINFNITITERNILDNFIVSIQFLDILSNRTTSESLERIHICMGNEEDLIFSDMHYNEIELKYDESALINQNAYINVSIDDSRVTALLYLENSLIPPTLLNTFTIENQTFEISYSVSGNYTFILEVYHDYLLYDSLEFWIVFEALPSIPLDWIYLIIEILLSISAVLGVIYILKYL